MHTEWPAIRMRPYFADGMIDFLGYPDRPPSELTRLILVAEQRIEYSRRHRRAHARVMAAKVGVLMPVRLDVV